MFVDDIKRALFGLIYKRVVLNKTKKTDKKL